MKAEMELTILGDGTITIKTGNMAGEHHASADEFIKLVQQLAGGTLDTQSTRQHQHHHHQHQQEHRH